MFEELQQRNVKGQILTTTYEDFTTPETFDVMQFNIFNEGVDIPSVNKILMLRPTQSAIVFIQQLGRGLRKLDFLP